jgi:mono/diheme cytochrome c family protein
LKRKTVVAAFGMVLAAGGCTREQWHRAPSPDDAVALVPWFATMHKGIAIQPYKMPLQPVEGTVPVTGTEHIPPAVPQNQADLDRIANPVQRTAASLERGKARFEIYCAVCHGPEGLGNGPVAAKLANAVRNLTDQRVLDQTDGWMYGVITNGFGALMPEYGSKIRPDDRWNIINYVRTLQGGAR